jgi:mannitol/fructose-specific phosphotransferase system IIA component (Ntr-type)
VPPIEREGRDGGEVEPRTAEPRAAGASPRPEACEREPGLDVDPAVMDLPTLTRNRYVWLGLSAPRKETAIELLLDRLLAVGAVPSDARGELLEAIMARERRLSTGLEAGIAIPHGTTSRVETEVAALGVFPAGVPFEAVDDSITRIVILLITPQCMRHRHVVNLAAIARQLLRPEVRGALLSATSVDEAVDAIGRRGA